MPIVKLHNPEKESRPKINLPEQFTSIQHGKRNITDLHNNNNPSKKVDNRFVDCKSGNASAIPKENEVHQSKNDEITKKKRKAEYDKMRYLKNKNKILESKKGKYDSMVEQFTIVKWKNREILNEEMNLQTNECGIVNISASLTKFRKTNICHEINEKKGMVCSIN